MNYSGVDYHKGFSYCTPIDEKGKVVWRGKVYNNREDLKKFVSLVENEMRGLMEATGNWTMMYEYLEDVIEDVRLAHPMMVKAIVEAKIKTDWIDSQVLAHLINCDLLNDESV
ncbi:MAG: IS110 family transposase [Myxococcota bacterium]